MKEFCRTTLDEHKLCNAIRGFKCTCVQSGSSLAHRSNFD